MVCFRCIIVNTLQKGKKNITTTTITPTTHQLGTSNPHTNKKLKDRPKLMTASEEPVIFKKYVTTNVCNSKALL
jgi:hypothetical protein